MLGKLHRFLIAAPIALLFSVACWGQTTIIQGEVKGEDGKPLPNAVVKIDRKDIKGAYKTKTDKKGHYFYGGLPLGTYRVSIEIDGKERDAMENVGTHVSAESNVNFNLQASAGKSGGAAAPEQDRSMSPEQRAANEKKMKEQTAQLAKNKALNDAFNAGKDAANVKNWDSAVENFQKASELDPAQHVVWANLADAYASQAKAKPGPQQAAVLEKAAAAYQKALEIKPDDPAYHNNYALLLVQEKKYPEARAELTKAAQLDPEAAGKYYYNLGAVLINIGQTDGAADAFKKAMELEPNYADAHYQYGLILIGRATTAADGKIVPPPGTADEFQKYLQLAPNGSNADAAKAMLATLGQTVETQFSRQPAKKK